METPSKPDEGLVKWLWRMLAEKSDKTCRGRDLKERGRDPNFACESELTDKWLHPRRASLDSTDGRDRSVELQEPRSAEPIVDWNHRSSKRSDIFEQCRSVQRSHGGRHEAANHIFQQCAPWKGYNSEGANPAR